MPVTRCRDVANMPPPPRRDPATPETYARIKELWRFSARPLPALFAPGVQRFRTIEELGAAREHATIARMRAIRAAQNR